MVNLTGEIKMVDVRKFNEKGLEEFESFLSRVRSKSGGSSEMPPFYLLEDSQFSDEIKLSNHIKRRGRYHNGHHISKMKPEGTSSKRM